jgi:SAM-dependent methyltransferase
MPSLDENKALWDGGYDWRARGEEWSVAWGGVSSQWWTTLFPRLQGYLPVHTVLEIAPGFGRWTHYLKDLCAELVIVDLSAEAIDHCKQRFARHPHVRAYVNDGTSLGMVDAGTVDLVFSFDSLVHVETNVMNPYLEEIARVLSPDGVAFVHHSNVGAYSAGTYDASVTHWRGRSVSAASVEAASRKLGLSCVSQEKLAWGNDQLLNDCISVITRRGSRWDRTNVIRENMSFRDEIALAKRRAELYPPSDEDVTFSAVRCRDPQPHTGTRSAQGRER